MSIALSSKSANSPVDTLVGVEGAGRVGRFQSG